MKNKKDSAKEISLPFLCVLPIIHTGLTISLGCISSPPCSTVFLTTQNSLCQAFRHPVHLVFFSMGLGVEVERLCILQGSGIRLFAEIITQVF
jgi:hypothetical protein